MRVVVIDDNPVARIMIGEMLGLRGHQVVGEGETMAQALKAYETLKPDLVTLDLSMAQEDGKTILLALRKLDGAAKVLVISGLLGQAALCEDLAAAGASGFLPKPFTMDELAAALLRVESKAAVPAPAPPLRPVERIPGGLIGAIRSAAEHCAVQLAKVSGASWTADAVTLGADSDDHFETLLSSISEAQYGACCSTPDLVCMVIFPRKSGFLVADRFTREAGDSVDAVYQKESSALAEVSQLLAAAVAAPLADATGRKQLFAAPQTDIASPRDLVVYAFKKFKGTGRLAVTAYLHLTSAELSADCSFMVFLSKDLIESLARP